MPQDTPKNFLLEPTPHDEAVAWIAEKPVVSKEVFNAMLPELRARAFLITGIEDANVAAEVRDIVAKLPAGQSWEKTKKELVAKLGPWLSSDDDAMKAANARAELLLRTHGFQAYQVAQHKVMREQEDVFPFWQYLTLDDEKVRPGHAALNFKVVPANEPFWHDHSPPWQWGCRCRKVPILPDEAEEMQAEDAKLPPEQQRVLSPAGIKLADQGRIYNKAGQQLDIKSDRQKGKTDGFVFDPDALTMPLDSLKGRYDPTTWGEFEQGMKTAKLDDGRTVWGWLNGEAAKVGAGPKKPAAVPPTPAPAVPPLVAPSAAVAPGAPPAAGTVPDGTPLTGKLDASNLKTKKEQKRVADVLTTISGVHGDGPLTVIPVTNKPGKGNWGVFHRRSDNGEAYDIGYQRGNKNPMNHPELTLAHEMGHWLDSKGVPGAVGPLDFMSQTGGTAFAEVIRVAQGSDAVKALQGMSATLTNADYYLKPWEIFARAYAQFIAEESQHPEMLKQVAQIRKEPLPERQWETQDFAPVRAEMRKAFVSLGWMKEVAP